MRKFILAAAALATVSTAAYAAVTFDPATGRGFVGKGDVQLLYGWNNKDLQTNAANVDFRYSAVTVTEVTWECTKQQQNGETTQEKARTTTTSTQGLVTTVARENSKGKDGAVTGFNLSGYEGGAAETSSTTEGPAVNSCPANPSGFVLSSPAGDPVEVSSTGGLEVTRNGSTWDPIS